MGQPAFTPSAASWNAPSSMFGTGPCTVSALFVMPIPGTNVTVADVRSSSGG